MRLLHGVRPVAIGLIGTALLGTFLSVTIARSQDASGPSRSTAGAEVPAGELLAAATLPDLPISVLQNGQLPGSIANDRQVMLGGLGSDLWRSPADPPGEFWMVTDRGPNDEIKIDGSTRRTFPVPGYTPTILRVRLDGSSVEVMDALPIVGQSGQPVTGLPNIDGHEEPYEYDGQTRLAYNPSGLDIEGLVRTPSGEFWAVEEYGPSLVHMDASGKVLRRFVPAGLPLTDTDYPVEATLPAIFSTRTANRGFEGLTLSADGSTLYLAVQSPLSNPDQQTAKRSRQVRMLAFDIVSKRPMAEYVYRLGPPDEPAVAAQTQPPRTAKSGRAAKRGAASTSPRDAKPTPQQMRVSGLAPAGPGTLLVLERTSSVARLYLADLENATNILGSVWDDAATAPALEALESLAPDGVVPLAKTLAADLAGIPGLPEKIEGVAIVDATTIAVANDNDFDLGTFDENGNNVGKGIENQILLVQVPQPLW
jgi:phytase-like protein